MRIVVLTGYASIATAVEAIKLGASHYLVKPSNTDDIEHAFDKGEGDAGAPLVSRTTSIKTLEWERIHEVLVESDFNIRSEEHTSELQSLMRISYAVFCLKKKKKTRKK